MDKGGVGWGGQDPAPTAALVVMEFTFPMLVCMAVTRVCRDARSPLMAVVESCRLSTTSCTPPQGVHGYGKGGVSGAGGGGAEQPEC
jgi:hypothetical protein